MRAILFIINCHSHDHRPKVLTSVNITLAPPTATPIVTVDDLAYIAIEDGKDTRLSGWVGVDTVRAGFVLISWLIAVFSSPTDRMEGEWAGEWVE